MVAWLKSSNSDIYPLDILFMIFLKAMKNLWTMLPISKEQSWGKPGGDKSESW